MSENRYEKIKETLLRFATDDVKRYQEKDYYKYKLENFENGYNSIVSYVEPELTPLIKKIYRIQPKEEKFESLFREYEQIIQDAINKSPEDRPVIKHDEETKEEALNRYRIALYSDCVRDFHKRNHISLPDDFSLEGLTSLRYAFIETFPGKIDTSNIINFEGCFKGATSSYPVTYMDFSNGIIFEKMFSKASDWKDRFKYTSSMDCSKGLNYRKMFYKTYWNEFEYAESEGEDHTNDYNEFISNNPQYTPNYEFIAKMKVNPKGNFSMFFDRLPKEEAEHFRNWFPNMNIDDIVMKLTK